MEKVFYRFPKYNAKIPLGYFNAKVGRENIFKPTIGNGNVHQDNNDNGARTMKFTVSKTIFVKSTMFPHRNIQNYTSISPDGQSRNRLVTY
jgi:hypothetical protein